MKIGLARVLNMFLFSFQEWNKNMLLPKVSSCGQCDFNYIFLALSKALNQKIHLIGNKNKQTIPPKHASKCYKESQELIKGRFLKKLF